MCSIPLNRGMISTPKHAGSTALTSRIAGAVAGVFHDFALRHVDQRRPIVVTVPGHNARLDRELAKAQFPILDHGWLFAEINRTERRVGDTDG